MRAKKTIGRQTHIALNRGDGWKGIFAVVPSIGAVMIPGISCPACWPAYAGLLGSLGLGFVNYTPYLLWLTVLFLILAVVSLGYKASNRRGYKPFILGVFAAVIMVIGKFLFISNLVTYGGIILLIAVSIWNSWPKRKADSGSMCALDFN